MRNIRRPWVLNATRIISHIFLGFLLTLSVAQAAFQSKTSSGITYPSVHTFINDIAHYRITAICKSDKAITNTIICDFEKTSISKKDMSSQKKYLNYLYSCSEQDIQKELESLKKHCPNLESAYKENCELRHGNEMHRIYKRFKLLCSHPNRKQLIAFQKAQMEEDRETCIITTRTFTREFYYNNSEERWEYHTGPDNADPCGTMFTAYLEKDTRSGFDKFSWNYFSSTLVTNKKARTFLDTSCASQDTPETELRAYGTGSLLNDTHQLINCKFIDLNG